MNEPTPEMIEAACLALDDFWGHRYEEPVEELSDELRVALRAALAVAPLRTGGMVCLAPSLTLHGDTPAVHRHHRRPAARDSRPPTPPARRQPRPPGDTTMSDRPVIRVLNDELLTVLSGRTMTVSDEAGHEYDLRLFTAAEFLEVQHTLVEQSGYGEKITTDQAEELTRAVVHA